MNFNDYQKQALKTAVHYDDPLMDKTIWALGIAGEAGEVAEKWKKIIAYQDGKMSEDERKELGKEIGDILWYMAVFAERLGFSMDEIAKNNLSKLADRANRGKITGRGDNR